MIVPALSVVYFIIILVCANNGLLANFPEGPLLTVVGVALLIANAVARFYYGMVYHLYTNLSKRVYVNYIDTWIGWHGGSAPVTKYLKEMQLYIEKERDARPRKVKDAITIAFLLTAISTILAADSFLELSQGFWIIYFCMCAVVIFGTAIVANPADDTSTATERYVTKYTPHLKKFLIEDMGDIETAILSSKFIPFKNILAAGSEFGLSSMGYQGYISLGKDKGTSYLESYKKLDRIANSLLLKSNIEEWLADRMFMEVNIDENDTLYFIIMRAFGDMSEETYRYLRGDRVHAEAKLVGPTIPNVVDEIRFTQGLLLPMMEEYDIKMQEDTRKLDRFRDVMGRWQKRKDERALRADLVRAEQAGEKWIQLRALIENSDDLTKMFFEGFRSERLLADRENQLTLIIQKANEVSALLLSKGLPSLKRSFPIKVTIPTFISGEFSPEVKTAEFSNDVRLAFGLSPDSGPTFYVSETKLHETFVQTALSFVQSSDPISHSPEALTKAISYFAEWRYSVLSKIGNAVRGDLNAALTSKSGLHLFESLKPCGVTEAEITRFTNLIATLGLDARGIEVLNLQGLFNVTVENGQISLWAKSAATRSVGYTAGPFVRTDVNPNPSTMELQSLPKRVFDIYHTAFQFMIDRMTDRLSLISLNREFANETSAHETTDT